MVKIFADGANIEEMIRLNDDPTISGLTTNPTLMKRAGITDYEAFAKEVLKHVTKKPVSFEVFADDFDEMYRQAIEISSWGENVYVKIPITNTKGVYNLLLIEELSFRNIHLNITAITTKRQLDDLFPVAKWFAGDFVSVFAGRIADTGIDPINTMKYAVDMFREMAIEVIWASPREVLNVVQANEIGCHVITCTPDIIKKLPLLGKDLTEYSLDTVKMFYEDGKGFRIG